MNGEDEDERTRFAPLPGGAGGGPGLVAQPPADLPAAPPADPGNGWTWAEIGTPAAGPLATGAGSPTDPPPSDPSADPSGALLPPPPPLAQPPLPQAPVSAPGPAPARNAVLAVGTRINNNYEITHVLKAGGMGQVYRGIEIGTGDPVAIKTILGDLVEDEKAGLLFKREARTLRQLADDAIVRYYNYVHDLALDRYFLIMEFVEGHTLSERLEAYGALSLEDGLVLLRRLARGLARAHAFAVIHRDLSPDNIMLPAGKVSEARIIDFGIAKSTVVTEGTMHGQFAGKFKYVAPEQLGHYQGVITPRTDIYCLGLLTCAALLGRPLDMGASIVEAVQSRQAIPDLSALPVPLRPLLSHMLEPDPAARPESMDQVLALIDAPSQLPARYGGAPFLAAGDHAGPQPPAVPADNTLGQSPFPQNLSAPGASTTAAHPGAGQGTNAGGLSLPGLAVPGLSVPGLQRPGAATAPGGLGLPGAAGVSQGAQPQPGQPDAARAAPSAPPAARETGGGGKLLLGAMVLAFVAILGGVGAYAWRAGLLGGAGPAPDATAATSGAAEAGPDDGPLGPPRRDTREGFLAAYDTGPCHYLTRIGAGPNTGQIAVFSDQSDSLRGEGLGALPAAYQAAFGSAPALLARQITPEQCAVLDFVRILQGRGQAEIGLTLSSDRVASGQAVEASLALPGAEGGSVWAALVSPRGALYNLTGRLSEPVAGRRSLGFGLTLPAGAPAAPQLVLVLASPQPLARAAAARDGTDLAALLPRLLQDIADQTQPGQPGGVSAALGYMLLTP